MVQLTISIDVTKDEPSQHSNVLGKQPMGSGIRRAGKHLHHVHQALFQWHANTHNRDYLYSCFTGIALLPDAPLTIIASNRCLKKLDDLQTVLGTSWAFIDIYGEEVLALVNKIDEEDKNVQATV